MKMKARFTLGFAVFVLLVQLAAGQQRLMVVGGGTRPAEATKKFVEWSGGTKSKILVITWASGEEDSSYDGTQKVFMAANPGSVEHAVVKPLDAERRAGVVDDGKIRRLCVPFFAANSGAAQFRSRSQPEQRHRSQCGGTGF